MNSRAFHNADAEHSKVVQTAGEVLPGNRFLELVKNSKNPCGVGLLYWVGKQARVEFRVRIDERIFEPLPLSSPELHATRIPDMELPKARSPEGLFSLVSAAISGALRLDNAYSARLSFFCISTWLSDALPVAPPLLITGPDPLEGLCVLRLLHALCRRPILLSGARAIRLASLSSLFQTLLLFRPELGPKSLENQLQSSNYPGVYVQDSQELHLLCRPKAAFVVDDAGRDDFFNGEWLRLSLDGCSPYLTLKERRIEEIANELQSQLLAYRLANWSKVHDSDLPMPDYHPAVRNVASALTACTVGNKTLVQRLVSLLAEDDIDARGRESTDLRVAIIESLLACSHAGEKDIAVKDLATKVNVLIRQRGELNEYSAMEVGWKLRALSLIPRRRAAGRVLFLDSDAIRRIHDLGRSLRVTDFHSPKKSCTWCKQDKLVVNAAVM